jgi:hypothetical protein
LAWPSKRPVGIAKSKCSSTARRVPPQLGERARVERRDVSFVDRAAVHRIERLLDAS